MSEIAMRAAEFLGVVCRYLAERRLLLLARFALAGAFAVALLLSILAMGVYAVARLLLEGVIFASFFVAYLLLASPDEPGPATHPTEGR
jgi:hypothetical protein